MGNIMSTKRIIEEFFEERFNDTSNFFLYKDKQLLKQGKYKEYAEEQINKANKIFTGVSFGLLVCVWYAIQFLVEYGADPNLFDLSFGLFAMAGLIFIVFYACREYYTIKSSMSILIKIVDQHQQEAKL